MAAEAVAQSGRDLLIVDIEDPEGPGGDRIGALTYDDLLAEGDPDFAYTLPDDEWDALALNYTSGTTGRPKGVVYSHRGAWTNAVNNVVTWEMPHHPVYLWTLPLFHCNGWCFPWTITMLAGTHVFLRAPRADAIYDAFADHGITHLCGAPIIMSMIAVRRTKREFPQKIKMMTAAAPPLPASSADGGDGHLHHPCLWPDRSLWSRRRLRRKTRLGRVCPLEEQAEMKARQGVAYELEEDVLVLDPETGAPVPWDGETLGEIVFRGNIVMKGLSEGARGDRQGVQGRLVLVRRHRRAARRRLHRDPRPIQGHHHLGRRKHLVHRSGKGALFPPRRRPGRRRGDAGRKMGRGALRLRRTVRARRPKRNCSPMPETRLAGYQRPRR